MADDELSGMLASAVVKVTLGKLVTALRLGDASGATMLDDENLRGHMVELKQGMETMAEMVGDADRRSTSEEEVREWLMRAEDAAYGIWDMVDELQANNEWNPVTEVHRPCLPIATARKGRSIASRMHEAKENLDGLLKDARETSLAFRRDIADKGKMEQSADDAYAITPSFDDNDEDYYIVGRDEDRQRITDATLSASSSGFMSIFGMGGIGKTTLAKLVFRDARVIRDYARAWVTVGPRFDLKKIGNCILSQISSNKGEHQDSSDVELIMKRMDEFLHAGGGGNKLLVVLDDLCSDDSSDLEGLERMLAGGAADSSKVVIAMVTTSSPSVARALGVGAYIYNMEPLSTVDSLRLFKRKVGLATGPKKEITNPQVASRQELETMLELIATKCSAVPLAIHAIGSTLRSRNLGEIKSVLNSDMWKWMQGYRDVLPVSLLLSYQCMPPSLRLCFAYCAVFPRGHSILKDDLIHHWTALQLIEPSDRLSTTRLANKYIDILLDMSFLQPTVQPSDDRCAGSFILHDMVHDFAMEVISKKIIVLDSTNSYRSPNISIKNSYRRACLTNSDISPANLSYILSAQLEVLHFYGCSDKQISDDSFSSAKYLRVLDLRDCQLEKLPDSIFQLKQLRYLKFSGSTRLVNLPDSFGNLINLWHIDLSSCSGLSKLPPSFGNLTSVMHINLSGCSGLSKLPPSFGNLTSVMHINLSGCAGLKSLTESFGNLTNVVHVNLSGCVGLKSLPQSFVLLEKLEYLDLSSCSCLEGKGIQSALGRLTNLQHLNLSHPCCYLGEHRFHLSGLKDVWAKLTNLRYLNLSMCLNPIFCYLPAERIKYIESISCLHTLEHLDLSHNIFLSDLPESLGQLSQLQTLNLSGCIRLKRIEKWMGKRNFPSKSLVVSNCLGLEMYQFVVRTDGGTKRSNLSQLKDVICKELEISCLEKVISTEEAQSIGLAERKKLQKLTLVWSVAPEDASFKDHKALLEELVPPQNLQCFELHGYSSEHLPAWLTSRLSSHLPNLVEVSLADIPSCSNLPPFGVLPNLQRLILRRVAKVTRIDTVCLSGGSKAAFHRLLHVTLDDMLNLEEFSNCSSKFPTLDELVINSCPKLRFGDSPPRARMLVISDCEQLMSSPVKRKGYDAVEDPSSWLPSLVLPPTMLAQASSSAPPHHLTLEDESLEDVFSIEKIFEDVMAARTPSPLPSTAVTCGPVTEVVIESCEMPLDKLNWSLLQGLAPLHSLHIRNCSEKIISPEIMKGLLSSLKLLCFSHCDSMTNLPEHVVQDTSLQELIIHECRGIKSLPQSICEEKKKHYTSEEKQKHYPLLRIRGCPELKQWCELEENKMKLAHIQIIFEESGTSKQDKGSLETSD